MCKGTSKQSPDLKKLHRAGTAPPVKQFLVPPIAENGNKFKYSMSLIHTSYKSQISVRINVLVIFERNY